jgi:hypothetical protein
VYGDVPPLVLAVALPLLPPLQDTLVDAVIVTVGEPALVIVVVAVRVHPAASVIVHV